MSGFASKFFKFSFKNMVLFAFIWLMVGFTTGTETLIGPVRWSVSLSRQMQWGKGREDIIVKIVIALFVAGSFLISLLLVRTINKSSLWHVKIGILAIILLASFGALFFWLNPQVFGTHMDIKEEAIANTRFSFGPYPTEQRMVDLKKEGYTAVISLLHPAVVPFEPKLLADERKAAKKAGIDFIHIPMLPWVSENKQSLEKIMAIAETSRGRYYVHCYLGKDRINMVKKLIERARGTVKTDYADSSISTRKISDLDFFERGKIYTLDDEVYLTPYPTDEEFFAFILSGSINHVVSLLNPDNPEDVSWIEKERKLFADHLMPFDLFPISSSHYDPQQVLDIVQKVWLLPRPLVIHVFLSPSFRTEAFIQAFRINLPPLPPILFREPLKRGEVQVIAPNIAAGPRPDGYEFGSYLYQKGVRNFAYLGDPESPEAKEDSMITKTAGLDLQAFKTYSSSTNIFNILAKGGPWYVYGPFLSEIREELKIRFGPAIPESVNFDPKIIFTSSKSSEEDSKTEHIYEQSEKAQAEETSQFEMIISSALDIFNRSLPDMKMIILLGPLFLLYGGIGGAFVGRLRMRKNVRTPYTRKIFHFYIFSMAGILHLSAGLPAVILFGVVVSLCVLYATYRGKNFPFYEAMARPTDEPHRTFYIIVPLITTALGGGITNLFFSKFAYVGYFVGGWGDAVGEPVGTQWGKHKYRVPSLLGIKVTRSLEGSTAVCLAGFFVAFLGLFAGGIPLTMALYAALACGIAGAAVEAISTHGLDNLTVQSAAAATAYFLLA